MRKTAALGLSLLLAVPAAASAADYVFNVPVYLEQMPRGVARARVHCEVYADESGARPLGSGSETHPVDFRTGSLHRVFNVRINVHGEHQVPASGRYACHLLLLTPWASPPWQPPSEEAADPSLRPAPDTEFRPLAEGPLPTPSGGSFRARPGPP